MTTIRIDNETITFEPKDVSINPDGNLQIGSGKAARIIDKGLAGKVLRQPEVFVFLSSQGQASEAAKLINETHTRTDARYGAYAHLTDVVERSDLPNDVKSQVLKDLRKVRPSAQDMARSLGSDASTSRPGLTRCHVKPIYAL